MRLSFICSKGGVGSILASLVLAMGLTTGAAAQCPGEGNCCEDNGSIGCDDIDCCTLVCGADPFCCAETWDGVCAGAASELCPDLCGGPGAPENNNCADAIEIFEGDTAYSTIDATTDGPEHSAEGCQFDGQTYQDVWFVYNATSSGEITVTTCGQADYDTDLVVYDGCDCAALTLLACNDDATGCAGFSSEVTINVIEGNCYLIRVGGWNDGDQGTGTLSIIAGLPCPGEGCCYAANGTPGCDDATCCATVCGIDPFCCDIEWDGTCAAQAVDACFSTTCEGNTNGDLAVDVEDLVNVILAWDSTEFCGTGPDVSPNGIIDVEDLVVVILNWGSCPACTACGIEGTPEGEECGTDTNGGCNSDPAAFGSIAFDETVCGDGWADGGTRDTDWYLFSHEGGPVTATLTSEFNGVVFLVDGIATCTPVVAGATGASNGCEPLGSAVADLPAGEYVVFVAPADFEGAPCGGGNNAYSVTLTAGGEPPVICGEGAGDCCDPAGNGSPGCENVECCETVCAADAFCCDTEWDGICAGLASDLCGDLCGAPAIGACCIGTNCEDGLTSVDCAGIGGVFQGADTVCSPETCAGPANDNCEDATPIFDGVTAFTNVAATDDGPPTPGEICAPAFPAGQLGADVWFQYDATFSGTLTVSTCDTVDYDSYIASYTGGCSALELVTCNDDGDGCGGFTSSMDVPVVSGTSYLIRIGGFNGAQGSGDLVLTPNP